MIRILRMIRMGRRIRITANHMIRKSRKIRKSANHMRITFNSNIEIYTVKLILNYPALMVVEICHVYLFFL